MVTEHPRMRRLPKLFVVVGLSLFVTLGVGCKQGEGERCEQDSDCADGLRCSRMEVSAEAGRCEAPNTVQPDASTGNGGTGGGGGSGGNGGDDAGSDAGDDAAGTDASDDAPMSVDATSSDASGDTSSTSDGASDASVD